MAIATTLRNRLVGFLIIISLLLIALPALLGRSPQTRPENAEPLSTHGAVSDISSSGEDDGYAALLAPEDDTNEGLISENPELMAQINEEAPQGTVEELTFNKPESQTPAANDAVPAKPAAPANAEILVANRPAEKPAGAAASASSPTPASAPAAPASKPAASGSGCYTVQVGVFGNRGNAERLAAQLKNAGISARTENITSNGKAMVRVYAGDSADRASLESLIKRIEKVANIKGRIVPKS